MSTGRRTGTSQARCWWGRLRKEAMQVPPPWLTVRVMQAAGGRAAKGIRVCWLQLAGPAHCCRVLSLCTCASRHCTWQHMELPTEAIIRVEPLGPCLHTLSDAAAPGTLRQAVPAAPGGLCGCTCSSAGQTWPAAAETKSMAASLRKAGTLSGQCTGAHQQHKASMI